MLKIEFYLKKPEGGKNKLEYITISNPRKVLEGELVDQYSCELYQSDIENKITIYSPISPIDAVLVSLENAKIHLQFLLDKGYTVSDIENKQEWKLEKKSLQEVLQEKIDNVKNAENVPTEVKRKILEHFKRSFSKMPFKEQLEDLIWQ